MSQYSLDSVLSKYLLLLMMMMIVMMKLGVTPMASSPLYPQFLLTYMIWLDNITLGLFILGTQYTLQLRSYAWKNKGHRMYLLLYNF